MDDSTKIEVNSTHCASGGGRLGCYGELLVKRCNYQLPSSETLNPIANLRETGTTKMGMMGE